MRGPASTRASSEDFNGGQAPCGAVTRRSTQDCVSVTAVSRRFPISPLDHFREMFFSPIVIVVCVGKLSAETIEFA